MKASLAITGIEVRELRGVGWSVVSIWDGRVQDRFCIQPDRERMNRLAGDLFNETCGFIEACFGAPPYLKLAEAGHANP